MSEDKAFLKSVNKFAVFITIFIDVCMVIGYLAAWFYEEYPFRYVCFVFVIWNIKKKIITCVSFFIQFHLCPWSLSPPTQPLMVPMLSLKPL